MKKTISLLLSVLFAFSVFTAVSAVQPPAAAEAISADSFEVLKQIIENPVGSEVEVTLNSTQYDFQDTIYLPENCSVILTSGCESDISLSHQPFSGEMFFVPQTSSLIVNGTETSGIQFINSYSLEEISAAGEQSEDLCLYGIVAEGGLNLNYVLFSGFIGNDSGAAVILLESGTTFLSDLKELSFLGNTAAEGPGLYVGNGRLAVIENISAEAQSVYNQGTVTVSPEDSFGSEYYGFVISGTGVILPTVEENVVEQESVEEPLELSEDSYTDYAALFGSVQMDTSLVSPESDSLASSFVPHYSEYTIPVESQQNEPYPEEVEIIITSESDEPENIPQQSGADPFTPYTPQNNYTYNADTAPKQSITVYESWNDNNNSAMRRPARTQISLYVADGHDAYNQVKKSLYMNATLSAENNWSYTFSNLAAGRSYSVEQAGISDYRTTYNVVGTDFYISNQYTGPQPAAQSSVNTQQNAYTAQQYNNPQNAYPQQYNNPQNASGSVQQVTHTPAPTHTPVPTYAPHAVQTPAVTSTPVPVLPTPEPIKTETRSSSHAWIWIVLLLISAGAIGAVFFVMQKAKKAREAELAARAAAAAKARERKRAAEAELRKAQADIGAGVRRTRGETSRSSAKDIPLRPEHRYERENKDPSEYRPKH